MYYVVLKSAIELDDVGVVSTEIKRRLEKMQVEREIVRRVAVICFEAEMNLVLYTVRGGEIEVRVKPDMIDIYIRDDGPGIEDIEQAMQPGYSTAPMWVHEMGFGAGMGLPNIKKQSDEFEIESEVGKGTIIHAVILREGRSERGEGNEAERDC